MSRTRSPFALSLSLALPCALVTACSAASPNAGADAGGAPPGAVPAVEAGVRADAASKPSDALGGPPSSSGTHRESAPGSCAEAAAARSYVGCDFWPTVTFNPVFDNFDFAAVVANGGRRPAEVRVERDGETIAQATVAPGALHELVLPWVDDLKGPTFEANTTEGRVQRSVRVRAGAYHLRSDVPVSVWQFNPLQYEAPLEQCARTPDYGDKTRCLSVSNDAALLIPSTAMTGTYRLFGRSAKHGGTTWGSTPGAFTLTATADDTAVDVQLAGALAAGRGVVGGAPGDVLHFELDAGDVVQLLGAWAMTFDAPHADLSGSLVVADKPVQVIANNALSNVPSESTGFADHLEETVLPAEVLGDEYVVTPPSSPDGASVGHVVRLYGNVDETALSYPASRPAGAPDTLSAGEVIELGPLNESFVVRGNAPFAVASFMLGGTLQDPTGTSLQTRGDPAFSMLITPAQFRDEYTFLAPADYLQSYADIVAPAGAAVQLDGEPVNVEAQPIGRSGWSLLRVPLSAAGDGTHTLRADAPVGLQVMGFGHATGYYYPGGLNLKLISEPPVIEII